MGIRGVGRAEGMQAMVTALEGVKQVAIDLEHHSYRYVLPLSGSLAFLGGGGG